MFHVEGNRFSMRLLKLRSIGVVHYYEPTTLFPHEYPRPNKEESTHFRNVTYKEVICIEQDLMMETQ